ncbi:MAG: efflux RND transporter periplasmic adaptor subunit [Planctomycetes bacterium]|nr:efflux RND transporter periplasmic adaptor subunit [Planctomycetota bacterium]
MKRLTGKRLGMALAVLLVAAGAGGWLRARARAPKRADSAGAAAPRVVAVTNGALRVVVEATGRVVAEQEIEIKCKASGEIIKLPVDVSDSVRKGDVLLQLDPADEERSVRRAEVALAVSEARLAQARLSLEIAEQELATERARAEPALDSAQAKAQEAEARLARVDQLVEKKVASREELDAARTTRAQAVSDLEAARARIEDLKSRATQIEVRRQDVRIAEAEVETDKLSLSDAKQRLADTTVMAPIAGVVAERNVQVGQITASGINNVGGGTTVMSLADLSRVYVLVTVDESDIGRIEVGQRVRITVDAYPDTLFPGQVVRIATKGQSTSNVVTFEVKVEVRGRDGGLLKPEMTANVEIVAVEKEDVLLMPAQALVRRRDERFVTVRKADGAEERRAVTTGASDGEMVEILDGLTAGEAVVLPRAGADSRWNRDEQRTQMRRERMQAQMLGGGGRRPR